jgi:hypothetical protein
MNHNRIIRNLCQLASQNLPCASRHLFKNTRPSIKKLWYPSCWNVCVVNIGLQCISPRSSETCRTILISVTNVPLYTLIYRILSSLCTSKQHFRQHVDEAIVWNNLRRARRTYLTEVVRVRVRCSQALPVVAFSAFLLYRREQDLCVFMYWRKSVLIANCCRNEFILIEASVYSVFCLSCCTISLTSSSGILLISALQLAGRHTSDNGSTETRLMAHAAILCFDFLLNNGILFIMQNNRSVWASWDM